MKRRTVLKIGLPPIDKQRNYFVHTAILEGIVVFFCSTAISFFASRFPLFNKFSDSGAFVARRTPFLFVGKWQMPQFHVDFGNGQAVVLAILLFEWQAFIGRYP